MRRIIVVAFALVMALFVVGAAWTQDGAHGRSIDEILQEIMQTQNAERISQIDPDAVDMELLEELGDGVMELMISDERQHEWMDSMMGGEGSTELASMHAWLGYNYIQNGGNIGAFGPGMMGFGTMGPGMMGSWHWGPNRNSSWPGPLNSGRGWLRSMHYGWWSNPLFWIAGLLILLLIVALVVVLVRTRGGGPGVRGNVGTAQNALTILRERYARGELSREEYQEMKQDLQ